MIDDATLREALSLIRDAPPERGDLVYHCDEPDIFGLVINVKDPGMWNKAEIVWEGTEVSEWLLTKCLKVFDKADN